MHSLRSFLFLLAAVALLIGCQPHRWLEVQPGTYAQIQGRGEAAAASRALQRLTVDREANTVTLTIAGDAPLTLPFTARERDAWPSGCPTNLFHHYMEVLEIEAETLTIAGLALEHPILVRNCPREPEQLVLRADGQIGGGGSAAAASSLLFTR